MNAVAWLSVGAALWLAVAVPVSVLIGKVFCERDEQVPRVAVAARSTGPTEWWSADVRR